MHPLKIVFAGTPPFAAQHLQALIDSRHQLAGVYTQPDRAAGRGKQLQASAVKLLALEHGLPVYQPLSLRGIEEQQVFASLGADVMIVVAYGLILPQAILDIPPLGCLNVHASLLPRWRGAAPIERALLAEDEQTGVTIMQMDKGLDTGDILTMARLTITSIDDRQNLESRLAQLGCETLVRALSELDTLRHLRQKQDDSLSTYASKLEKSEALIHWNNPAQKINLQIRAGIGRNPAYCFLHNERVRILKADVSSTNSGEIPGTIISASRDVIRVACDGSALDISIMQFSGKSPLPVKDLLNARQDILQAGKQFTSDEPTA